MTREELDKMNAEIDDVRRAKVDALRHAMRHRGWKRSIYLKFGRFFDWAVRFGERIRRDEISGDWDDG